MTTTAPSAPTTQATAPAAAPAPAPAAVPPNPAATPAAAVPEQPTTPPATQAPNLDAPSTPEQPPAEQSLTLNEPVKYKHESTGNAAYDMAMTAFADKGFSPDHPAYLPATKGDFALLEKFVQEQGIDPQFLNLAKQAHQQISDHYEKTHGETNRKALEMAGGEERWAKIKDWVQKTADPQEIAYFKEQLEKGGIATLKAVEYLSGLYGQHGENAPAQPSTNPAKPFNDNTSPTIATNGAPLSPQEFRAEMGKLIDRVGYSGLETSAEYKVLQQRRQAWRG